MEPQLCPASASRERSSPSSWESPATACRPDPASNKKPYANKKGARRRAPFLLGQHSQETRNRFAFGENTGNQFKLCKKDRASDPSETGQTPGNCLSVLRHSRIHTLGPGVNSSSEVMH